jgi:hypothetical protein
MHIPAAMRMPIVTTAMIARPTGALWPMQNVQTSNYRTTTITSVRFASSSRNRSNWRRALSFKSWSLLASPHR